jgi:hypothetical protein
MVGLWWRLAKCRGGRRGVNKGMEIEEIGGN